MRFFLHAAALVAASLLTACGTGHEVSDASPEPSPEVTDTVVGGHEPEEQFSDRSPTSTPDDPWVADGGSKAPADPVRTGRSAPETPAAPTTVVLLTIDTWRADRLGVYGSPRTATSETLAAWAEQGVLFDSAWAPSPWTWPTLSSLATGLYPSAHGAVTQSASLCDAPDTLAETLHGAGLRTGFAGSNGYLEPSEPEPRDTGFAQGFEFYWARGLERGPRVLEFAQRFLDGVSGEPAFLHVHLFDPHCPYDAVGEDLVAARKQPFGLVGGEDDVRPGFPAAVRAAGACHFVPLVPLGTPDREIGEMQPGTELTDYLDAYDAGLVYTDGLIDTLEAMLRAAGRWEEAWLVVTGDHGEEFGDHGRLGHGKNVYPETIRVPLLVRPPLGMDGFARGGRVATPVSLVDLPPTLLSSLNVPVPASWQGRDVSASLRGESIAAGPIFAETDYETVARFFLDGSRALHRDLQDGRRVYDYAADPHLRRPLDAAAAAPVTAKLEAALGDFERSVASGRMCQAAERSMTPEQLEKLKALGYVGESESE